MALENVEKQKGKFVSILADGNYHLSVPKGTEGAVEREYETSSGKSGTKTELVFNKLTGIISKIDFWEGDYGKLIQVTIEDGEDEPVILSVGVNSTFGEEIMKKLPNVDIKKTVILEPYAFEDDKGKKRRGLTITQGSKKIESYYYDKEGKKNINGYPVAKKKNLTKSEWRKFFSEAGDFLVEDTMKRFKIEEKKDELDDF